MIGVDLTVSSSIAPTSLRLVMQIPGKDTVSRVITWNNAWSDGQARRVVLPFDALAKSVGTGAWAFTLEVTALNGGTTLATASTTDTIAVVSRADSPFGMGWWLAGLELLSDETPSDSTKLWIGGDGSTRLYRQQTADIWIVTPTLDRPDTLLRVNTSGTITWRRRLGNHAYVEFDNTGRHIATVNDMGHKTRFVHSATALDSLILPVPAGSSAKPAYVFKYVTVGGAPLLDTVRAPNPRPGAGSYFDRKVRTTRKGRAITSFISGIWAGNSQSFTVDTITGRISGTYQGTTSMTFGDGNLVTNFSVTGGITNTLCPAEGTSLLSCSSDAKLLATVSTSLDGPRTDVSDTSRYWLTKYGSVRKHRNPLGHETEWLRENTNFPTVVTKTIAPNGYTQRAALNSRGLIDSAIAVNPLGNSQSAVTLYQWHDTLNRVTQVTGPTGDITQFGYGASGLLSWQQDGRGAGTRTNVARDSSNRVEYIQPPGHTSGQRYRFEFDAYVGNLNRTTTPRGFTSTMARDSAGRIITLKIPVDSNPSSTVRRITESTYDDFSRLTSTYEYHGSATYSFSTISSSGLYATDPVMYHSYGYHSYGDIDYIMQRSQSPLDGYEERYRYHYFVYNPYRQQTAASDGMYNVQSWHRDPAGNVTEEWSEGSRIYIKYDAANRMTERRNVTTYPVSMVPWAPDSTIMPSGVGFPALGASFPFYSGLNLAFPVDTMRYTYDVNGNMLTANSFDARIKRSYYPNGAIATDSMRIRTYNATSTPDDDFVQNVYGLGYEYDLAGRRTELNMPTNIAYSCGGGCEQTYSYRLHVGKPDTITSHLGHDYTFEYDSAGRVMTRTAPGGVVLDFGFDLDDNLSYRRERRGVGILGTPVVVHRDSLTFDGRGKVARARLSGDADPFQSAILAYDAAGSLTALEVERTVSPTSIATVEYRSDGWNSPMATYRNRGIAPGTTFSTYADTTTKLATRFQSGNAPTVLTELGSLIYSQFYGATHFKTAIERNWYDPGYPNTGLTNRGFESAQWYGSDGKLRAYQRVGPDTNPEQRLVFEEYRYDALGRRVLLRSQARGSCTSSFCKSAIERYIWDGDQLLFEVRVPGDSGKSDAALNADTSTVSAHYGRIGYVHGFGIDAPIGLDRNGTVIIPHSNWRGFYDAGADTAGNAFTTDINWIGWEQDPFLDGRLPRVVNGWSGSLLKAQQDNSGLMYRRNRYYDPGTGQFTQSDPIGLAGGNNLYGFVAGDPVNFRDPFGLNPCWGLAGFGPYGAAAAMACTATVATGIVATGVGLLESEAFADLHDMMDDAFERVRQGVISAALGVLGWISPVSNTDGTVGTDGPNQIEEVRGAPPATDKKKNPPRNPPPKKE
jgi:RHS repeat-associated protein